MGTNDCRRRTSNMKLLAVLALASVAAAIPQGYHAPAPHVFEPAPPVVIEPSPTPSYGPCPTGTVRKGNGQCVRPVIPRSTTTTCSCAHRTWVWDPAPSSPPPLNR